MPAPLVIAMDGPAASGKSSVARAVAQRLGWLFVNTGNMYRAATWAALRDHLNPQDENQVARAVESWNITCPISSGQCIVQLDGHDIEDELNNGEVNRAVSFIARVPAVRDRLVALQREIGRAQPVVMEGRDIGTVVFPDAMAKFYIDATEEVRARRRGLQGQTDTVGERDRIDSTRKTAPLIAAADAVVIDSSHLSLDEVVSRVMNELQTRGLIQPEA
ncbi:MAG: (d)CMP kinase [Verrucomicrobia bacterium]|nr:(d)CMP kinase [Verrucomicrobiota bacterium]